MTLVGLMGGAALLAWVAALLWGDVGLPLDVGLGVVGPFCVAAGTWLLIERTYRRSPAKLTARMTAGFGFQLVFFAVYLAAVLKGTSVRSMPFVAAFTGSFVVFHTMEAFFLRRLFQDGGASGSQT